MNLSIIRQIGCYVGEWFRLGRAAVTDDITFEKVSLQRGERAWARHPLASDTRKVYLSDNSGGPPIIVEHVANMFRIFDTLRRSNSDDSLSICWTYNNKNEWSLCSIESLFGNIGGLFCSGGGLFRGGYSLAQFPRLIAEDNELQSKNDQLQAANNHKAVIEFDNFLIIRRSCFAFFFGLLGIFLSTLGWQCFDNKWGLLGATLIGGGALVGGLGLLLLWLSSFPFSWGWPL